MTEEEWDHFVLDKLKSALDAIPIFLLLLFICFFIVSGHFEENI
tara:strand:- start:499 stop:630 length:132 start_codon:yes stop_codon:yes gene_type:complete